MEFSVLGVLLLVNTVTGTYLGDLNYYLFEKCPPYRNQPPGSPAAVLLEEYYEASAEGTRAEASTAANKLAQLPSLPPEVRAAFLAERASNEPDHERLATLRLLKTWLPQDEHARYLIDLHIALRFCQSGSALGTFQERKAHMDYLFSTYSPYDAEIILMHFEFAQNTIDACLSREVPESYLDIAQQHIDEAQKLIAQLRAQPELAANPEETSRALAYLQERVDHIGRSVARTKTSYARVRDMELETNAARSFDRILATEPSDPQAGADPADISVPTALPEPPEGEAEVSREESPESGRSVLSPKSRNLALTGGVAAAFLLLAGLTWIRLQRTKRNDYK